MMCLPIVCVIFILLAWLYEVLRKYCCLQYRSWRRINSHGSMIIGLTLLLLYFFYLELIRRSLDLFNCSPTDPPEESGKLYTSFTSIECEAGYCVCYEEGGVHLRIFTINWIPITVYVTGFPLFVSLIIKKNRTIIMEDQLLRAHDLGAVEAENPFAFWVRQRYSRMYYQFKPTKVNWIRVILWRKFMLVFIGILLRNNPSFQLAIMLLTLFTCYVLHMKHRPYMSSVERRLCIEEHKALAEQGDKAHMVIASHIKKAIVERDAKMKRTATLGKGGGFSLDAALGATDWRRRRKGPESFFFNYNTMEAILLSCSILVCLCGVMFTSGQLDKPENEWQQVMVTFFLTTIFFGSMLYIGVVFASELGIKVPKCLMRCFADAKTALQKQNEAEGHKRGSEYGDIELNANPMIKSAEDEARIAAAKEEAEAHRRIADQHAAAASKLASDQHAMTLKMRSLKKKAATGGRGKARRRGGKRVKSKNKSFASTAIDVGAANESAGEAAPAARSPKKGMKVNISKNRQTKVSMRSKMASPSRKSLFRNIAPGGLGSKASAEISMDMFEAETLGSNDAETNPLRLSVDPVAETLGVEPAVALPTTEEDGYYSLTQISTEDGIADVYKDDKTGRRYSVSRRSSVTQWLADDGNTTSF